MKISNGKKLLASLSLSLSCALSGNPLAVDYISHFTLPENKPLNLPFSDATRVGKMIYISGQIGNKPGHMELVPGGIVPETKQAMENIKTILQEYDAYVEDLIECQVMLADINDWNAFNEVYLTFFRYNVPARSTFATTGLALHARVEVKCTALKIRSNEWVL